MQDTDKRIRHMEDIVREKSNVYFFRIPRREEKIFKEMVVEYFEYFFRTDARYKWPRHRYKWPRKSQTEQIQKIDI